MPPEPEIRAAEARVLFETPLPLLTSAVICALSVGVLWPNVPGPFLPVWAAGFALCLGGRLLLWLAYRARQPTAADAGRWIRRFALGAGATGVLWGALAAVMLISHNEYDHAFV